MTELEWLEAIHGVLQSIQASAVALQLIAERLQFLSQVVAFGVAWSAGCQSLKFFLYVKNHKDIW